MLQAVAVFVFATNITNASAVNGHIFDFCRTLIGRMRGGLARVETVVSVNPSGMSGSAIADAAAPGLAPINRYSKTPNIHAALPVPRWR